jgi:predicted regulator of Ras-like GTPase activity (Roadblock/LC7/MglB family)
MARLDHFKKILDTIPDETLSMRGAALLSDDGLIIASSLPDGFDELRISGAAAGAFAHGATAANEFRRGAVEEMIIRGADGYVLICTTAKNLVLVVLADKAAKLGAVMLNVREAVNALNKVI